MSPTSLLILLFLSILSSWASFASAEVCTDYAGYILICPYGCCGSYSYGYYCCSYYLSTGAIVGIVIGNVIFWACLIACIKVCCVRRRRTVVQQRIVVTGGGLPQVPSYGTATSYPPITTSSKVGGSMPPPPPYNPNYST